MRLARVKEEIRTIRNECYKKQRNTDKRKSVAEEFEMNKKISFFAVNSGTDIVLSISKSDKKWNLIFHQLDAWIKKEFNTSGDMPMNNPKDYGIKKKDHMKFHLHLYMLDHESKS